MKETEKIYQLAISYFEGTISRGDETVLFGFITQSDRNRKRFESWEADWAANPERKGSSRDELDLLKVRLQTRQAANLLLKPRTIPMFRKISVVAAVIALTVVCTLTVRMLVTSHPDRQRFVVETSNGEKSRITLPDGSVVRLNSASRIAYGSGFGVSEREMELEGEAYFEVAALDHAPFTVKTNNYSVVVKGTKFNVASYADDVFSTATLMEGKIEVILSDRVLAVAPGEQLRLDTRTGAYAVKEVDPGQYKSWTDNHISYDSITLEEVLNRLSRQYDVDIHLDAKPGETIVLNVSIKNDESIDEILDGLSKVVPMRVSRQGRDIRIEQR